MFVLLKVILAFFRPLVWIVLLLLAAAIWKKPLWKRRFFWAGLIALLFFSNPFIINRIIRSYEPPAVQLTQGQQYSAGILLGGLVSYNLLENKGYFNPASDRFIQTALLYKRGHISKIIVAAGNGYIVKHNFKEAHFIKDHLVQLGIPAAAIFTDPESKNTLQNAVNSKRIIDSLQLPGPFLLVSSALHLPRAEQVFRGQGMEVVPFPADFISKSIGNNFFEDVLLPSASALRNWDSLIKEVLGRAVYRITGKG